MNGKKVYTLTNKYMTHKHNLYSSRRYWERQTERIMNWEYVPKTPIDIMLKAIDTKLSHIDDDLFKLSLS